MGEYENLVRKAREKDVHAFAKLYELIYEDLYRYAFYMLESRQDAEDAVSESVIAAFEAIHKLKNAEAFRAWMFQIVTNQCKKKRKQYMQKTVELEENISSEAADWEEALDVQKAFQSLSKEERYIIGLSAFGGYKSKEIGRVLLMNPATVRSKLSRGLEKMKRQLSC